MEGTDSIWSGSIWSQAFGLRSDKVRLLGHLPNMVSGVQFGLPKPRPSSPSMSKPSFDFYDLPEELQEHTLLQKLHEFNNWKAKLNEHIKAAQKQILEMVELGFRVEENEEDFRNQWADDLEKYNNRVKVPGDPDYVDPAVGPPNYIWNEEMEEDPGDV